MLADRPYRCALPSRKAFEELHTRAGIFYDPAVVAAATSHRAEMLAIASTFADNTVGA